MTSNGKNIIFEKTSFLQGSNSPFIEELYLQYLNNPNSIPQSWAEFFKGLNEDKDIIKKEISGPSWSPRKKKRSMNKLKKKHYKRKKKFYLMKDYYHKKILKLKRKNL
tara:strand:- start:232 stop:555 length:324 start_codon:yes stop_codon:yes gene_type:complete